MKIKKHLTIAIIILLFSQAICMAGSNSVNIGNISVSLGDQKQTVITKLWNGYELIPDKNLEGNYLVIAKKGYSLESPISITFKNGEVYSITKTSKEFSNTELAEKLIAIMETLLKEKNNTASIEVIRGKDLLNPTDSLIFHFPNKKITVNIVKSDDTQTATILEILEKSSTPSQPN